MLLIFKINYIYVSKCCVVYTRSTLRLTNIKWLTAITGYRICLTNTRLLGSVALLWLKLKIIAIKEPQILALIFVLGNLKFF